MAAGGEDLLPALGHILPRQLVGQPGDVAGPVGDVGDVHVPQHAGADTQVVHRADPLLRVDGVNAAHDAHDGGHVAHVAVRVPAAHVADVQRIVKVAVAVDHSQGHHCGIGDDVAHAGIAVVAEVVMDIAEAVPPVGAGMIVMEGHDRPHRPGVLAVDRDVGQGDLHDPAHVPLHKGRADGAGHVHAAVDAVAVMGDGGRLGRQLRRQGRIPRGHQPPGVDENLPADLLRRGGAVHFDGAAGGGLDSPAQVQVGGMLGGHAVAAPPKEPVLIGGVVQQRLAHILGGEGLTPLVLQGPEEVQGAVAVVIRGEVLVLGGVTGQLPEQLLNPGIIPALHRRAQPDADDLRQPPGVHALQIIRRNFRHLVSPHIRQISMLIPS